MSKVQGCMKCVKYLLFVFIFIFWLSGALVLAVGLWLRFDPDTSSLLTQSDAPESFFLSVYILIGAGGVMMLVGFFGCFGAVRESQCLLGSFFAFLLLIFAAEITAGVFGFLNRDKVTTDVQNYYESVMVNDNATAVANLYHSVLECCGTESSRPNDLCTVNSSDEDCLKAIDDFFKEKLYIIGYVGIGIAGVLIIGMVFSMVLCCAIRNSREVI